MRDILFVNSIQPQCGCQSYGIRSFRILKESEKYNFIYSAPQSMEEYMNLIARYQPDAVIINYHPLTMPWLFVERIWNTKQMVLFHEGAKPGNFHPDLWLNVDSTLPDDYESISIPRPLIGPTHYKWSGSDIPVITTFGFGWGNKGFGRVVQIVNDQFDEAIIRMHVPRAFYGDRNGEATAGIVPGCENEMRNPGIKLEWSHDFKSDEDLLYFLSRSNLNIFLYDEMRGRGLSSVIDYALSVLVPVAINSSDMFRHIQKPEINVANKSLQEIIGQGTSPLDEFRELWSNENFLKKYEHILNSTL